MHSPAQKCCTDAHGACYSIGSICSNSMCNSSGGSGVLSAVYPELVSGTCTKIPVVAISKRIIQTSVATTNREVGISIYCHQRLPADIGRRSYSIDCLHGYITCRIGH